MTCGTAPAAASPTVDPIPARIDHISAVTPRWLQVFVDSPAMHRVVQIDLLLPKDTVAPRPTVYLLEGVDSLRPDQNDWTAQGGAVPFFDDKDVNVVLPVGGDGSYYTDWQSDDPVLGRQKWETMLTKEIPPLFDRTFGGSGTNAVIGLSMGGQSAVMLAERTGPLYRAVAAYSGCYRTSDPVGQAEMRFVVGTHGGTADNMWGRIDDPDWVAHDVATHAPALRGKLVYLSSGSGLPGPHENSATPDLANTVVSGGALEAAVNECTTEFADRLHRLHIAATVVHTATGTHSWPYWTDQLEASWPSLAAALGV
ncbi:esterase family protein [Antrihabitans cavernicola]|uniref:Esterase family protein n=2 Tax=Antrihabitans cavernicola TaxID=2495913 RepID=A0A5A7S714_9NOCA|nr:esterase family protein [Spelaeibacter cavernicola]